MTDQTDPEAAETLWCVVVPRGEKGPLRLPSTSQRAAEAYAARYPGVTVEEWTGSAFDHYDSVNADVPEWT